MVDHTRDIELAKSVAVRSRSDGDSDLEVDDIIYRVFGPAAIQEGYIHSYSATESE